MKLPELREGAEGRARSENTELSFQDVARVSDLLRHAMYVRVQTRD